jgi:hypothetical protein
MTTIIYYRPDDTAVLRRLLSVIRDPIGARLDDLAAAFPLATADERDELIAEAAELLTQLEKE